MAIRGLLLRCLGLTLGMILLLAGVTPVLASPGLCIGPVCADQIRRGTNHAFLLHMRVTDQRGHHERTVVDCRDGHLSPASGPVERGHVRAIARKACQLSAA
ncbi:MAG: hypothetical protein RLZZ274_2209 [Cyanobacteriota bacterium]|jgi:hypothetical protein